jgi:hypothetical protein
MKTQAEIKEEIITINYYLLESISRGDKQGVKKNKLLLDNLIKIYLTYGTIEA